MPKSTIHIRAYTLEDAEPFYACIRSSLGHFMEYLPWVYPDYSLTDAKNWVQNSILNAQLGWQYDFLIERMTDKILLGGVGLLSIDAYTQSAFLGYFVCDAVLGQGVATAAARLAMQFAKEQLHLKTLYLDIALDNVASHRIAEKLSAEYIETLANHEFVNGQYVDAKRYRLIL